MYALAVLVSWTVGLVTGALTTCLAAVDAARAWETEAERLHTALHPEDPCAHGHAWEPEPSDIYTNHEAGERTGVLLFHCQRPGCPEVWIDGWICGPGELVQIRRPGEG